MDFLIVDGCATRKIYNVYKRGSITKNTGATYKETVFSTLNIEREFTVQCVIMQGISDYLSSIEYPDERTIGFKQISPPVMTHRASGDGTYEFTAEAVYGM